MYEFQVGEDEQSAVEEVKGNKMRECKCVWFCLLPIPAVPGAVTTWVTYLGNEDKAKNWANICPPFYLRLLKVMDLHNVSGVKRGRREGNRKYFSRREQRHALSSPWLPCGVTEHEEVSLGSNWGTWRSAKEWPIVLIGCLLKWSNREHQGLRETEISLCKSQVGTDYAKRHCGTWQREQQSSSIHKTNRSAAYLHTTNPKRESGLSYSLPQSSTESSESGTEMTSIWNEENCFSFFCITNLITVKFIPIELIIVEHVLCAKQLG